MKAMKNCSLSMKRLKKSMNRQIKNGTVKGLYGFFEKLNKLKVHQLFKTKVVVDGDSLIRCLTRHLMLVDKQPINQLVCLDRFEKLARTFFVNVKFTRVNPIVVFGGMNRSRVPKYDQQSLKLEKISSTRKNQLKTSLLLFDQCHSNNLFLFREQMIHTINEMGLTHLTTQLEGPNELVSIANQLKCPIVSNNTTFFIMPLTHGFIPLNTITLKSKQVYPNPNKHLSLCLPLTIHQPFLKCSMFNIRSLKYRWHSRRVLFPPKLLPVFATLCGNDFVTQPQLKRALYSKLDSSLCKLNNQQIMLFLFTWLQNFRNPKYVMSSLKFLLKHNPTLFKYIKISINNYRVPNVKTSQSTKVIYNKDHLKFKLFQLNLMSTVPDYIKQRLQNGMVSPLLLNGFINGEVSLLWKLYTNKVMNTSLMLHTDLTRNLRRECYAHLMSYFPKFTNLTESKTVIKQVSSQSFQVQHSTDVIKHDDLELFKLYNSSNVAIDTIVSREEYSESLLRAYLREIGGGKSDVINLKLVGHRLMIMKLVYWVLFHDIAPPLILNVDECQPSERLIDMVSEFKSFYFFFNQLISLKCVNDEGDKLLLERNVLKPSAIFTEKLMNFLQLENIRSEDNEEDETHIYLSLLQNLNFFQIHWFQNVLEECLILQ